MYQLGENGPQHKLLLAELFTVVMPSREHGDKKVIWVFLMFSKPQFVHLRTYNHPFNSGCLDLGKRPPYARVRDSEIKQLFVIPG